MTPGRLLSMFLCPHYSEGWHGLIIKFPVDGTDRESLMSRPSCVVVGQLRDSFIRLVLCPTVVRCASIMMHMTVHLSEGYVMQRTWFFIP